MLCIHCGASNPDTAVICRNCGQPARMTQQEAASSRSQPSRPPTWQPAPQEPVHPSPWQSVPQQPFQSPSGPLSPRQSPQPLPRQVVPQQSSQPFPRQALQPSMPQPSRNSASLARVVPVSPTAPATPARPSTAVRQPAQTRTARSAGGRSWLFIGGAGIILLALVIGSVVFFLNHSFTASSNAASQTLTTYCDALKSQDYQTAYAQLASGMKNQLKESDFAYSWQQKKVSSCTVDTSAANAASCTNTSCSGSITFFFSDGSSGSDQYQLIQENGQWKIQSQTGS